MAVALFLGAALVGASPTLAQPQNGKAANGKAQSGKAKNGQAKKADAKSGAAAGGGYLGTFGDWEAYRDPREGYCYAGSKPQKEEGRYTQRGDVFVLVTHRPKEKSYNVVSFDAGYVFKDGAQASAVIGAQSFALFGQGEQAWTRDAEGDAHLVKAMRAGATMVVKGTSARGTATTDTYSLTGVSAALDAIDKACAR